MYNSRPLDWLLCFCIAGLVLVLDAKSKFVPAVSRYSSMACYLLVLTVGFFWWFHIPTPGKAIGLMGFAAIVMALKPDMGSRERALWIFLAAYLLILELRSIDHERFDTNKAQLEARQKQDEQFRNVLRTENEHFRTTTGLIANYALAQQRLYALQTRGTEITSLKHRAAQLSADALAFLTQRNAGQPQAWMFGQTGQEDNVPPAVVQREEEAQERYEQQTDMLFNQQFLPRIVALHEELLKAGQKDDELEKMFKNPTTLKMMNAAVRIGAVAEKMK